MSIEYLRDIKTKDLIQYHKIIKVMPVYKHLKDDIENELLRRLNLFESEIRKCITQ